MNDSINNYTHPGRQKADLQMNSEINNDIDLQTLNAKHSIKNLQQKK